ncbi:hypothetical protein CTAYLR_004517 [Chrysophaeum taylorii]|uniref:Uncharacterized protein n=1 Tax=Chrysophaeum taylorii TaxID=2483200 RepID=A0AAD7XU16_9STRA|nr:hypothetical protein CTAYLR_004517 [Chrysophaeum taylorii]
MCDRVCLCFSEAPLSEEEVRGARGSVYVRYLNNDGRFAVSMMDACYYEYLCCFTAALPVTFPCTQLHMRYAVLNHVSPGSEWSNYVCCQGYIPACCCFAPGECCEAEYPRTCMCLEAWCFPGLAVSSTRFLVMDHYSLQPDPCDNRLIRANNCIQLLACVCEIAAHFDQNLRDLSQLIEVLADLVFLTTAGCMTAQVWHEMKFRTAPQVTATADTYSAVATTEATISAPLSVETIKR